jgi:hypothetical protein
MVFLEGLQNMERMATALGKAADATAFKEQAVSTSRGIRNANLAATSKSSAAPNALSCLDCSNRNQSLKRLYVLDFCTSL